MNPLDSPVFRWQMTLILIETRQGGANFGSGGAVLDLRGYSFRFKGVQFFAKGREAPSWNNVLREIIFLLKCVCFSLHPLQNRKKRGII